MPKYFVLGLFLGACFHALSAQTIDLCYLAQGTGALASHPMETPLSILGAVVVQAGWRLDRFELIPTQDPNVRGNALAEVCREPLCNCIFYDPAFLSTSPSSSFASWIAYYVLAHEAGHIIMPDTGESRMKKEAAADDWAGWALEKLHAPIEAVMAGVDHIAASEDPTTDYHGRCQRRMDALAGYNRGLVLEQKPQLQSCNQCFAASSLGLYLTLDGSKGAPIRPEMAASCGSVKNADLPTDFNHDLRGACLISDEKAGTQLSWDIVGICSF